jgi:hypothetical protein
LDKVIAVVPCLFMGQIAFVNVKPGILRVAGEKGGVVAEQGGEDDLLREMREKGASRVRPCDNTPV